MDVSNPSYFSGLLFYSLYVRRYGTVVIIYRKTPIMVVASQVDLFSEQERKAVRSFLSSALSNVSVCLGRCDHT